MRVTTVNEDPALCFMGHQIIFVACEKVVEQLANFIAGVKQPLDSVPPHALQEDECYYFGCDNLNLYYHSYTQDLYCYIGESGCVRHRSKALPRLYQLYKLLVARLPAGIAK